MLKVKIAQDSPTPIQIDLECAPGEMHALVGPSGSGKTTVLRTIAGLSNPHSGRIECDGETWFSASEKTGPAQVLKASRRSCGFLFQQYALFPHLTALQNICIPLHNLVLNVDARKQLGQEWLERMGIGALAKRFPHQLSGGQQQRVALARALARKPKALLLDEPFSAIDIPTRQGLYKTLAELRSDLNIPILLVTHDLREADLLADRITVIDDGISLQTATPQTLFHKPRNSRVAALVGITNLFHGNFNAGKLAWQGCDHIFQVIDKGKIPPNTAVAWVIPQSGLSVHKTANDATFPAIVEQISSLGQIAAIQLMVPNSELRVNWEASVAELSRLEMAIGHQMHIQFDHGKIHIMPLRPINDPRLFQHTFKRSLL
ncbi:ABC transporter ATP-binding protein [Polynucleobacter meluiroseus]|nr:ABC transporter ATP-binding protein [Polynucleobacter meluiroseus]